MTAVEAEDAINANFGGEMMRMGSFIASLSQKSAYMLFYVKESQCDAIFDKRGLETLVQSQVAAAVKQDMPTSLPQAFTIALPHGRGYLKTGGGGGGSLKRPGSDSKTHEPPLRSIRGLLVGVTVPDAENATVEDLREWHALVCPARGVGSSTACGFSSSLLQAQCPGHDTYATLCALCTDPTVVSPDCDVLRPQYGFSRRRALPMESHSGRLHPTSTGAASPLRGRDICLTCN